MTHYTIDELSVGMEASFERVITEQMMEAFYLICGDDNPLHMDEAYARSVPNGVYQGKVVYGMLTASLYSTMAGCYLPGERSLLYEVDSKFTNPVYVGDCLQVYAQVTEVEKERSYIRLKARITNQKGVTVSRAKIMVGVRRDE